MNTNNKENDKRTQITQVFTHNYETNAWGNAESKSGSGSTLQQTQTLRKELASLLKKLNITSMLDAPCGDFNWMKEMDLTNINYTGCDIVSPLITENIKKYQHHQHTNITFKTLDVINDTLPKCDLILCRDCFVHLQIEEIFKAVKNFKKSGSTYLLTTTFLNPRVNPLNYGITGWRPLNLFAYPFNFPTPICLINENCTEENYQFTDKSLALWKLEDLNV